jgi:Na+-transporting NADH:ubiquinone oxidoreductase subunit NqrD
MAAFPFSFLKPGTSLLSTLRITKSVVQVRAEVYIGQNAVFAGTGSGGAAGAVLVSDSAVAEVFGEGAQADKAIKETAARTAESFLCTTITHSMPSQTRLGRPVNT